MTTNQYTVILVFSTSHALRAERVLEKAGIPCKLIPVPRHLSSDCGSCLRTFQTDKTRAIEELRTVIEIAGVHDI